MIGQIDLRLLVIDEVMSAVVKRDEAKHAQLAKNPPVLVFGVISVAVEEWLLELKVHEQLSSSVAYHSVEELSKVLKVLSEFSVVLLLLFADFVKIDFEVTELETLYGARQPWCGS